MEMEIREVSSVGLNSGAPSGENNTGEREFWVQNVMNVLSMKKKERIVKDHS